MATHKNASYFSIPVFDSTSEFRVNTSHFSQEDLLLFIENLEIIQNLKREKHERRQRRKEQIRETRALLHAQFQPPTSVTALGCAPSPTSSLIEELQELHFNEETAQTKSETQTVTANHTNQPKPKRPISQRRSSDEDETYFSDASTSPRSTPNGQSKKPRLLFTTPTQSSKVNSGSDSEESGVFPLPEVLTTPPPKPMRYRAKPIFEKPKRSARSRILALILRRELTHDKPKESEEQLSGFIKKATSNLNVSKDQSEERDLHEVIKQKYKRFAGRYIRKKLKNVIEEEVKAKDMEILDKALRYMTL
ncbi:uncharacterized protein LOC118735814 [Rhagoletis pomonella]|uniref:uncharacterized protein LOC118735814 n=1 Tax=Rhagoletis pomonella TaxID=28610 RepID=UPI001782C300|nr:uncharacterized protein LOC118735814 [Rhagoletis pomonella]